jgi:8-oxo-dGTP diphosphatase
MGEQANPNGATGAEPVASVAGTRRVVAALIRRRDKLLICQRGAQQPMAFKWEFPGGKIEPGESSEQALVRELNEELGIHATIAQPVTQIRHTYKNGGVVELEFFLVETYEGDLENRIFNEIRWERVENLPRYDFLAADHGLVRDLAAGRLLTLTDTPAGV